MRLFASEVVADDEASSISKVTCGLSDILAGEVVGQRLRLCCRVSQVQKHQYLLIVRKAESLVELIDVHAVQPAGLHSCILCSEHEMCRHYGSILYARLTLSVRIGMSKATRTVGAPYRQGVQASIFARASGD